MTPEVTYLLDVNVLLALANSDHVHHGPAHRWFATIGSWATTPLTETAFVRLQSNPAVVGHVVAIPDVLAALSTMRAAPGHVWLPDDTTLAEPRIPCTALVGHRQVTDFHLANLAASSSMLLATFDASLRNALVANADAVIALVPV